jgi:hypothetical protein
MYVGHMDYNGNEIIEKAEIDRFLEMFNNGRGVDEFNDGGGPIDLPIQPSPPSDKNDFEKEIVPKSKGDGK